MLYDRQKSLDLKTDISITIVGVGGIGFWVGLYSAMSGIKKIYLYDPDVIERVNLNRLPVSERYIGENKTVVLKKLIENVRPECTVFTFPYKLTEFSMIDSDYLIDCTDNFESQLKNQKIANEKNMKYIKSGYNGMNISINDKIGEWGEAEDGYTIIPSWVVPASIVASLTVGKIMVNNLNNKELGCKIERLYIT